MSTIAPFPLTRHTSTSKKTILMIGQDHLETPLRPANVQTDDRTGKVHGMPYG
jgi:hypothetical protein